MAQTTSALAHRMNAALSVIEVSPRTGAMQITHTLSAHDMEGALGAGAVNLAWFETPAAETAIKDYCLRHFTITDPRGRPLRLTFIGVELRGDIISVYFEAPIYRRPAVIVDSNILQDVSDAQVNRVNLRARGRTISQVFEVGAPPRTMTLP